jgi:hypothetical protein
MFQFSTRQILLATAFVAITCGGIVAYIKIIYENEPVWRLISAQIMIFAPVWTPGLFVAYAIGRRMFTTRLVVIFALMESLAVFISWGTWQWLY